MFALRPYQDEAVSGVETAFAAGERRVLVVQATGTGKTVVFGEITRRWVDAGKRVLILAHRAELLEQARDKLLYYEVESAIEKADLDARLQIEERANSIVDPHEIRCVVGSVQSFNKRRLERWPADYFDLIIVDEAHHAISTSYRRVIDHFAAAKVLGVTATPDRLDGRNVGEVFGRVAAEYHLDRAIEEGYLCPLKWLKSTVQVDLRGIKTTAGDYNLGQLEDRISENIEPLVNGTREVIGDRRAIVFTPDCGSAAAFAEGLRQAGVSARDVNGASRDRSAIIEGFRHEHFQVLVNCMLLTEGADFPFVEAVVLARPTQSRALLSQMVGRGTRLYQGKDACLIVDFAWLTDRHELVSPVELIVPEADGDLAGLVEAMLGVGRAVDLREAKCKAEEAKKKRESDEEIQLLLGAREALRLNVRKRQSGLDFEEVQPLLGIRDAAALHIEETWASKNVRPTERQVEALVNFGVPILEANAMSRHAASKHLDWLVGRSKAGMATLKQVLALTKAGVPREFALTLSKQEASRRMDTLYGNRRRASCQAG